MKKLKDVLWYIRAYILQPKIPVVSVQYILDKGCSYTANDYMKDKYVYYWEGDFKKGKEVKVKSLDILRYEYSKLELEYDDKKTEILGLIDQIKTHDIKEDSIKNKIVDIINMNL